MVYGFSSFGFYGVVYGRVMMEILYRCIIRL